MLNTKSNLKGVFPVIKGTITDVFLTITASIK
jgi:hypothetical protein